MHNLSFWQEPDWKRESTLNPNFLMAVIIALFVVASIAMTTFANRSRSHTLESLDNLKTQLESIKTAADELKAMQADIALWQGHLDTISGNSNESILWSRQLEALQRLVPAEIRLTNLEIRAEQVREKLPADSAAGRPMPVVLIKTVYHLRLQGEALGQDAQATITDFAQKIASDNVIGDRLKHYEVQNISEMRSSSENIPSPGKTFVFSCVFKELE